MTGVTTSELRTSGAGPLPVKPFQHRAVDALGGDRPAVGHAPDGSSATRAAFRVGVQGTRRG